jgi:hypothetical protein
LIRDGPQLMTLKNSDFEIRRSNSVPPHVLELASVPVDP